jgi:hypothetical protein
MSFSLFDQQFYPADSYSRQLDRRVAMSEYPYGYEGTTPPEGYQNGPNYIYENAASEPQMDVMKEKPPLYPIEKRYKRE